MRLRLLLATLATVFLFAAAVEWAGADPIIWDGDWGDFTCTAGTCTTDAGAIDFAAQSHVTIGASPAATCTAGQIHIDTDQTVDTNCTTTADNSLCLCTATDTWTALENN